MPSRSSAPDPEQPQHPRQVLIDLYVYELVDLPLDRILDDILCDLDDDPIPFVFQQLPDRAAPTCQQQQRSDTGERCSSSNGVLSYQ